MKKYEIIGNMWDVVANGQTLIFNDGTIMTVIFIDDSTTSGDECWELGINENGDVFVKEWHHAWPEEVYDVSGYDIIRVINHKASVADLYLYKTNDEAYNEKRKEKYSH